ncbi:HI1506-related protein [Paramagnetospirillum magneticum]|nr:HI1506-related protein [Paramagnetospirillum magneticum]
MKMIRVLSKVDGFRRGGRAWTGSTTVPASEFTKDQIAALKAEDNLVVDEFDAPDPEANSGKPPAKGKAADTDPPK